jgi:hypothetical protein
MIEEYTIFNFITDVGAPIASALFMGAFIFIIIRKIMEDVVVNTEELKGICSMLITRIKVMNNDMIRIDVSVSSALDLTPDLKRISRAENFVEDGTIDARRD